MVNYWVVRIGSTDQQRKYDIAAEVKRREVVGIGWPEAGNVQNLQRYQDVVQCILDAYPGYKIRQAQTEGSSVHTFAHKIDVGDVVLTPMTSPERVEVVLISTVTGGYQHNPQFAESMYLLTNTREVQWVRTDVSWDELSPALNASLCSNMTAYSINKHADEINQLLESLKLQQRKTVGGRSNQSSASRSVTPETIAKGGASGEWDQDEQQLFRMRTGLRQKRNKDHQELVQGLAHTLPYQDLREYPFDYVALTPSGVLLAEMKTLDGTPEDERRQVRAAIGQLLYYEGLCLPDEFKGQPVTKIAVFDRQPTPEHAGWMESLNVMVVWQDEDGRFVGLPSFTTEENA